MIIQYGLEINNSKAIKYGKDNCIQIKIEGANEIIESDGYDANIIASYLFYEAALVYESMDDKNNANKLKVKALEYYPKLDTSKFKEI